MEDSRSEGTGETPATGYINATNATSKFVYKKPIPILSSSSSMPDENDNDSESPKDQRVSVLNADEENG